MRYKAILFDMDGTLVPMDMDQFTSGYFKLLAAKLSGFGFELKGLTKAIWTSVGSMVKNDGSQTNEAAFWKTFEALTGKGVDLVGDSCLDFYSNEFNAAKIFTGENPLAREAVDVAKTKCEQVVLATNPLFPMPGQVTRMSWVGLKPDDFSLVTSYEEDIYCKPNPLYFTHVCQRIGVEPKDCLLIGNDEYEDMYAASKAGLSCYLITDTMIPSEAHPWEGPKGTFAEMIEMLRALD